MNPGTASVSFLKRCVSAPRAVVACLSLVFFVVFLHLGLGSDIGAPLSATLGAGDHAVLRHSVLLRDGVKPVVAAEHADRSSAPPPQLPALLVLAAVIAARSSIFCRFRVASETSLARHPIASHRPRAPPIAA